MQGRICEEMIGGGKNRSEQSELEDSGGFGVTVSPQTGPGQSPENFQICVGRRIT